MDVVFWLHDCGPDPDESIMQEVGTRLSRAAEECGMRFDRLTYEEVDRDHDGESLEDAVWETVHQRTGDVGLASRMADEARNLS